MFQVGYVEMERKIRNEGEFYELKEKGMGGMMGGEEEIIEIMEYNEMKIGVLGILGEEK